MSSSDRTEHLSGPAEDAAQPQPRRTPSVRRRLLFLGVGIVLAALLAVGLFGTRGGSGANGVPKAGDPVPAFTMGRLGGGSEIHVPGNGASAPTVLVFFASWCEPCQTEIPAIAKLYASQQASQSPLAAVHVVGVDGNDPTTSAIDFVHKSGVTFPVGTDEDYSIISGKFGFAGLPETVFVQRDGTIAAIHYGAISVDQFTAWQRRLVSPSGT